MGIRQTYPLVQAARSAAAVAACLVLANCASSGKFAGRVDPKYGVSSSPRVVAMGEPVPKGGGTYRVGKPYTVGGRVYVPEEDTEYREEGLASWYGDDFHGRLTANGEVFDMASLTAAHPTLRTGVPAPSLVRVASARSFVPEIPPNSRPIRGEVPMPEGRPYSLGNTSADMASMSATSEMSASSRVRSRGRIIDNPHAVSYENDGAYAPDVRPVSAYAPIDPRGPRELLAGRGLY